MPLIRKLRIEKQEYDDFIANNLQDATQSHSILSNLMGILTRKEYRIILTSEGNDAYELKLDEKNELYLKVMG